MSKNFNIFIKLANSKTITMETNEDMLVSDMKKNVMILISKEGNQFDDVFLSAGTKIISENSKDMKVNELGITKDSTIFALPRLRGGSY